MMSSAPPKHFTIAIVLQDLRVGGTVLVTLKYASVLAGLGYEVTLIVIEKGNREADVGNIAGIKAVLFTGPCTLRELSEIMDGYDAVIISNGVMFPFALEASRFTKRPLIVELLHNFFKAALTPSVDMTVAVSVPVFMGMQPREQDVFVPNGVDVSEFSPAERKKKEKVTLVQVAREGKAMDPALEAIAPDLVQEGLPVDAWIVGRDGRSSENIRYFGVQPHEKIRTLLQEADILLYMSAFDTFGMPPIEAMAAGTIPVVSNVDGLLFSVENGRTGYVVQLGDRAGVKSVLRMLVHRIVEGHQDIADMRSRAIRRVHEKFNLSVLAGQLGGLIEERARTMPRENRSSGYPFSFIAPFLFFDLKDSLYYSDYYFAVMEDVLNAVNPESALADWRDCLGTVKRSVKGPPQALDFLDEVYSSMVSDECLESAKGKAACFFWLALLALPMRRYDRIVSYLNRGAFSDRNMGVLPLKRIVFALICYWSYFMKQPVREEMLRAGRTIKDSYCKHGLSVVESLEGNDGLLTDLIKGAGFPGLLEAIEKAR